MTCQIAIVGAGPAGLSAAAHAQELGLSYVLLEGSPAHANTIQHYQKGKHVMAEPGLVPLRSALEFKAGSREQVLGEWEKGISDLAVNIRFGAEVTAVRKSGDTFQLTLKDGPEIEASAVVLSIGLQGNPRKLGVDGEDAGSVQYTLDDPDEYQGETIVIVGACEVH